MPELDDNKSEGLTAPKKAVAKKAAPKKAVTKKAASKSGGTKGIFVKTKPGLKSFRRAGFAFNHEGFGIALDALGKGQLKQLEGEDNLIVERCTFSAKDSFIKK